MTRDGLEALAELGEVSPTQFWVYGDIYSVFPPQRRSPWNRLGALHRGPSSAARSAKNSSRWQTP